MVSIRHTGCKLIVLWTILCTAQWCHSQSPENSLKELRNADVGEAATSRATELAAVVAKSNDLSLIQVLKAMQGATPTGRNWLLGIANQKFRIDGAKLTAKLEEFLADKTNDGEARYKVLVWLAGGNTTELQKRLATMYDDPSPEIRYAAIDYLMQNASDADVLRKLLDSARHPNQVVDLIKKLEDAKVTVDQAKHFGFLTKWRFVGPFDHVGVKNFNKVFTVETDYASAKFAPKYDGKNGSVEWNEHTTDAKDGNIDLAKLYSNEKGCIVYGYTEFESPIAGPAEIRLGCINGHKIWVNGQLAMSNEVYHSSTQIDQYIEPITLVKGLNRILIKVCQNEQKEQWAQQYQFMLRITDASGKAIQPAK